jgi:outer membrane protein OmpA-like peptidoglycan-associated protein/Mg-chelatase subunit ChlD
MRRGKILIFMLLTFLVSSVSYAQKERVPTKADSIRTAKNLLNEAKVKSIQKEIELTIRNVDITRFPEIRIIVEAYNKAGDPLDTLYANNLTVTENGAEKKVLSVEKISVNERVPVDFVFAIDMTGSMQKYIDAVRKNLSGFTQSLVKRGIDYRLGLVLFSDYVEKTYQLTDNVGDFLKWLSYVKAHGGGDSKENALEAMTEAANLKFRPAANRVLVLVTDAPYHQIGEKGDGVTGLNTEAMIKLLNDNEIRVFAIVPPKLTLYKQISRETRGTFFDVDYPFSTILDNFSNQLTNLYALTFRTDQPAIPDSINIGILNEEKQILVKKTIPIVELGRKLIIENLLYKVNSFELPDSVAELNVLYQFMNNKKNVVIMVEGHTDNRGSHRVNDYLSKRRAESVKNYIVKKGINKNRIRTRGYGKRKPIASNNTDFGRALNRRTEIVIIAK